MCGIFLFILKRPLNKKDILLGREGKKILKHRGLDSDGEWYNKKEGVYTGHTEIINDKFNGWLCDINNMTDTTNLVLKIIKDKKYLEHITENAFFFVKKNFDSKNHVKIISYFYN